MSYREHDDFWSGETPDDGLWKEPRKAELAPPARPRLARPVTVLTLVAGALALAFVVGAVLSWLPSRSISATAGLAPAGTGRLGGAQSARPHRPGPVELSLARYFNNIGIASAGNQDAGNIDGGGFAFSVEALAAAGAGAGATITSHGVPFTWPDAAAGTPDNVVASGQALRIKGAGHTLAFLLTAGWGPATGTGEVVYASGATQKFTVDVPDWWTDCSRTTPGDVLYTPYRYPTDGQPDSFPLCVYYASVPLHAGQPVKQIVLPDVSGSVQAGDPSLHIFAVTIH
jgi:hypothetical protein